MLLSQLVEINEKGSIVSAVNFDMINNPEMNLQLCEGFIFNYDAKKPELSTVGILDALRRSYHSRNEPNIHLIIQDYGKGKSHFAVAIANFFKEPFDSCEVQGILRQVEVATNKNKAIAEGLKLYKQNQLHKHLVICLSGDKGGDIKKQFLQIISKSLLEQGITDSLGQSNCIEPLHYLESLNEQDKIKVEKYLQSIGYPDGNLNSIIYLLRDNNPGVIAIVKEIALHITGFTPDFTANIDIEAILKDLVINYCTGENARFHGILIIFDELNYYLQSWSADQIGAGGTALQNITNICENYKGKIALLSFAQFHPSKALGISANTIQSYQKIATRLAPKNSTYDNPASSLELVLDNLLIQKENSQSWGDFHSLWFDSLVRESRSAYEQRIRIYKEKGWTQEEFYQHLGKGCFPLHPLTAYLLCNLDFTQDRTAIQFVKGYVKKFIQDEAVEKVGQLNYIYPIALVDTFIENFSNESVYSYYKKAIGLVAGSNDTDELTVIKALFLFYACGEKLTKPDREDHQEILVALTGLSKSRLKIALDKLEKTRDVIYYRPETKLYRFWEGVSPTNIENDIEEKIKDKHTSIHDVIIHCQSKIKIYLNNDKIAATQFIKDNKLVNTDWHFECKIYSIDGFVKALNSDQTLRSTKEKGILAYVLAETQEDLQEFRRTVDNHLSKSHIKNQIAVAIPSEETGDLARVLLKIKALENKDTSEQRLFGAAYSQLLQRCHEQVDQQLERLLKNCTFHCVGLEKIPVNEQSKSQRVISVLLQELYPFVPPVDEIDKMRSDHATGSKVTGFVCKQVFTDSLTPQTLPPDLSYKTVIDTIFVIRWGLLKKTSQKYIVQEPTHEKIRAAWDKISEIMSLEGLPEKVVNIEKIWNLLSINPYGYSEYTFIILLAGWLAYHRKEVSLEGTVKLAKTKNSVLRKTQSLDIWGSPDTDIFQKPTAFISDWVIKGKAKLIHRKKPEMPVMSALRMNYDQAQQYLAKFTSFLESNESDSEEVVQVTKNQQEINTCVEKINNWFQPVLEAEALSNNTPLETLLQLYPRLMERPPAIDLSRTDVISVQPTQHQRDRQTQALKIVSNKLTGIIEAVSRQSESLLTEDTCNTYKVKVQATIDLIDQIPSLSLHLAEILRNAIRTAEQRLTEIRKQAQVRNYLSQIQSLNERLNDNSTQHDYTNTRAEIEALARGIFDSTSEAAEVQQILQNIDQCYRKLSQQIDIWEECSSGVTSQTRILELIKEITSQDRRFTEGYSQDKIRALQKQLQNEFLRIGDRDEAEKLVKAELATVEQKLQRVRDLPCDKLSEAFQVYKEIINSSLTSTGQNVSIEEYHKKLDEFKTQGRTIICEKFAYIYTSKPNLLEECAFLKEDLQNSINILSDTGDFIEIKGNIEQALINLELHSQNLQKQLETQQKQVEDKQLIQEIRKYNPVTTLNTLCLCEEAIREIETLSFRLNDSEQYKFEITQLVESIQNKVIAHRQRLSDIDNRLGTVDNLNDLSRINTEYAKLEFIFQNSIDYQLYQELQPKLQFLSDDLEQIQNIEYRWQQCNNISSLDELLKIIEQLVFRDLERFQERITRLQENVRKGIQDYTSELQRFEASLEHIATVRDAQKLEEELLRKSARYANSDIEKQYKAIRLEVKLLIELLQIVEPVNVNTLNLCQVQLDKLRQWQNVTEGITDKLRDRLESLCIELEQKKLQITQHKQADAQKWLQKSSHHCTEIYQLLNDDKKLEAANKLLKQIQTEKHQYISFLNPNEVQSLEYIERQCIEEQGKHKANQIFVLFQQLPRIQRQNLYEKLTQYLLDSTEELNG